MKELYSKFIEIIKGIVKACLEEIMIKIKRNNSL